MSDCLSLSDVKKSGDREKLIERLVTYLLEPTITLTKGVSITPSKKRKSVSGSKKSTPTKAKKVKVKRAPSAYTLFVKEHSAEVKKEHPDFTFAELSKHVAGLWGALEHGEKEFWNIKASDAKIAFDNENAKSGSTGSSKKAKKESSADADAAESGAEDEEALFAESADEAVSEAEDDQEDPEAGSEHEHYEQEE
eukprot:gene29060-36046_t